MTKGEVLFCQTFVTLFLMRIPLLSSFIEKIRANERPPFEKFFILVFILFVAFLVGDLASLYVRQYLLPTTVPPKKMTNMQNRATRSYNYPDIITYNIFNADHVIPPSLAQLEGGMTPDGAPRLSQLPLDLIGTIVHANPKRSLATINQRGQNLVEPFSVGQTIAGLAEVKEILRERVILRNLQTQGLEYIEIPHEDKILLSTEKGPTVSAPVPNQEKTEFKLKREEINSQLEKLPELLQQARVVPEMGPDGQVKGYCMVEMQPGSLYEKLGLRIGDCIRSVNGELVNSPQKAMQLFQELRGAQRVEIGTDRAQLKYDIE
jgi:general secretion pathway protein C